jgi:LEA14-like dessication related protein
LTSDVKRTVALAVFVLGIALLAACATLPRLAAPKVTVDRVRVDRLTPLDAQFTVVVTVSNPNDRAVAVDAIEAELRIEDVLVGTARLATPVRLAPLADSTASLAARATLADALQAAAAVARRAETTTAPLSAVRYAVSGRATVDGGQVIPFSRSGEIPWPRNGTPR